MQQQGGLLDDEDLDGIDELADEFTDNGDDENAPYSVDTGLLTEELAEVERYAELAESIPQNAKGQALLRVLDEVFYSADHALAQRLTQGALERDLPVAELVFDYGKHGARISALEPFIGQSGWLEINRLTVESLQAEEFIIFAAHADDGTALDDDQCQKIFTLDASEAASGNASPSGKLADLRKAQISESLKEVDGRNVRYFDEEVTKLDRWADDLKFGLEREIKEHDKDIRESRSRAATATSLTEKLAAQKELKTLEAQRNKKRRELYDTQDTIDAERDTLIADIEKQLKREHKVQSLFTVRWRLE